MTSAEGGVIMEVIGAVERVKVEGRVTSAEGGVIMEVIEAEERVTVEGR